MLTLVTGASGHLGANLVRALLARERRVRALVRQDERALAGLAVERVTGDVTDVASVRAACAGVEVVHHLAGVVSLSGGRGGALRSVNVDGARHVADAALAAGVRRLVHYSSIQALEAPAGGGPYDEDVPRVSAERQGLYGYTKALGEAAVRDAVARGLDAVVLHPTGGMGPHDYKGAPTGRFLRAVATRWLPAMVAGGFDWVDLRDVAESALAAETRGEAGASYILGGHWHRLADVAAMACEVTGRRAPRLVVPLAPVRVVAPLIARTLGALGRDSLVAPESVATLQRGPRISSARAIRDLGHRPRPVRDTVHDTVRWLLEADPP